MTAPAARAQGGKSSAADQRVWLITYQEALRAGYATDVQDPVGFAIEQAKRAVGAFRKSLGTRGGQ